MREYGNRARKEAEAKVQQLCSLGLGSKLLIPAVLDQLHEFVPSHSSTFLWADNAGNIVDAYNETPDAPMFLPYYLHEFYNRSELDVFMGWRAILQQQKNAIDLDECMTVERSRFQKHRFYNEYLSPLDIHWQMHLVVRDGPDSRGVVMLHRGRREKPFSPVEARCLERLSAFLAYALEEAPDSVEEWVDGEAEGLLVADRQGRIVWQSPAARHLLFLANHDRVASSRHRAVDSSRLPRKVKSLCDRLEAVQAQKRVEEPPVLCMQNAWGRFRFAASRLEDGADSTGLIGITVRHQEPKALRLMRRINQLRMTPRQRQVCLLMARGESYAEIADQMGITENTAISHSRAIYDHLDVHNRQELASCLLNS